MLKRIVLTCTLSVVVVSAALSYNVYFGNMHSHCALSDGIGTPDEAFAYARDVADIDVLALTDHTHLLTQAEWTQLLATANAYTQDGVFVALGAQEFGNLNDFGHMNIFDCLYRNPNATENLMGTYQFIKTQGAIAAFNHPNPSYGTNFNDLAYYAEYLDQMIGIEIRNGKRADDYEDQYIEALQHGWQVGPMADQDNHEGHWGDQTNPNMGGQIYLTGLLANALTRAEILSAMRERRFFAMEVDPPSDRIFMDFYANGIVMGQEAVSGAHLALTGTAQALNGVGLFNRVDLFQDGILVDYQVLIATSIAWTFDRVLADGERHFYFVRVRQVDGDYAWSAPIWVTGEINPAEAAELQTQDGFILSAPAPNPFRPETAMRFFVPDDRGEAIGLRIYALSGSLVGGFPESPCAPGWHTWTWGSTDEMGRPLPAGVYLAGLTDHGRIASTRRLVRLP